MKNLKQKNNIFKIETIKTREGNGVSCCSECGGITTSLQFKGKEVLYMDKETLENPKVNVKGGIPILFPNAGPIPDELKTDELKNLKQHGFARDAKWDFEKTDKGFRQKLISNEKTKEIYPYDFVLTIEGQFNEDGSFSMIQTIENTGDNEMPVSSGFHPYFKVPAEEKKNIEFNFEGGDQVLSQIDKWANGQFISIQNPNSPLEVNIPQLGTLVFDISKEFERIWVWSMPGKDFICIEPVMRDKGGIITDPVIIKPKSTHLSSFNIMLKS